MILLWGLKMSISPRNFSAAVQEGSREGGRREGEGGREREREGGREREEGTE